MSPITNKLRSMLASIFLDDDGRFDVQQLFFFAALLLLAYGSGQIYRPAGFIVPGVVLLYGSLPSRPPLFLRGPMDHSRPRPPARRDA